MIINKLNKTILVTGASLGLLAVVLGAFGAHGLEKLVDAKNINSFNTGVQYQMYHSVIFLILGNMTMIPNTSKKQIFYFFLLGILFFSGSIYILVMDAIFGISLTSLAFLTPVGGFLLILGWIWLLAAFIKNKTSKVS